MQDAISQSVATSSPYCTLSLTVSWRVGDDAFMSKRLWKKHLKSVASSLAASGLQCKCVNILKTVKLSVLKP